METHEGKSVPIVKDFQIEGSWVPVTPVKPILPRPRPNYEGSPGGLLAQAYLRESEEYLSRFSQQTHPQTLLSCSISSAEKIVPNYYTNNNNNSNLWDPQINFSSENVEPQRRGLEDYLPHWTHQGRRSLPTYGSLNPAQCSSFPSFSSWDLPFPLRNNGLREKGSNLLEPNPGDPFARFDSMSFGDPLKGPIASMRLAGCGNGATSSGFSPGWDSRPEGSTLNGHSMFRDRAVNQRINGVCGKEAQSCAFPHEYCSPCNVNPHSSTKLSTGNNHTFVPLTPDLRWRSESHVALENNSPDQWPNKQNRVQEQEAAAAAMVNLQELHQVPGPTEDSLPGKVSMGVEENHNPDKGGNHDIDLNKTPQKKLRRKRYLPKVLSEKKPRQTTNPKTPKTTDPKEGPRVKRKYVRKNKTHTPLPASPARPTEAIDRELAKPASKSCRRSLNFELDGKETENDSLNMSRGGSYAEPHPNNCQTAGNWSSHTVHLRPEEFSVESSQLGVAYDLNRKLNEELRNYISLPEKDNVDVSRLDETCHSREEEKEASSLPGNNADLVQSPNSSPCASSNEGVRTRGSKRGHSSISNVTDTFCQPNHTFLGNANIHRFPGIFFPEICKKKRTEKGQRSHASTISSSATAAEDASQAAANTQNHPRVASKYYYYCNPGPFRTNAVTNNQPDLVLGSVERGLQLLNTWADMARLKKKKRSKGATRVRDLASLKGIASVAPAKSAAKCPTRKKIDIPDESYPCIASYNTDIHVAPRSKKRPRKQNSDFSSRRSSMAMVNKHWDLVLYDGNLSIRNTTGSVPALPWVNDVSLEAITEGMQHLNINRECCKISCKEHNALVLYRVNSQEQSALVRYKKDGTVVPYEGTFDPVRKRRQRAKVDLDDETTRVWKLLLENIDNEGIDGTDEEKAKWWENERRVFRGRVDSFIARMRLVQGDRRFTPWKGSVLDSVIGVFLTQNVSDHLSSSAFMSVAARFPLKSETSEGTLSEEATSALVVEPEESIIWHEKTPNQLICDSNSTIIHDIDNNEEKEVVNSKELIRSAPGSSNPKDYSYEGSQKANSLVTQTEGASVMGDDRARDDATSSQHSVMSFLNSVNSPNLRPIGIMQSFLESSSKAKALTSCQSNYFDCSASFMGLLKMAESPLLHESYGQILGHGRSECLTQVTKDFPEAQGISSSEKELHLERDFQPQHTKYIEMIEEESRSSDTLRKDENSPTIEQSNLTTESTPQHPVQAEGSDSDHISFTEKMCSCYVLEGEKMVVQSERQPVKEQPATIASSDQRQASSSPNVPNSSQESADVAESTTALKDGINNDHKEVEQIYEQDYASGGISDMANTNPIKPKRAKTGKDKRNAYDWDNLRKQAQVNGRIRERTANTRDSVDWEAVRLANVSEIADTIKERGMNNMLAERIQDLLNRLIKEHGSVDMEWLRDIPPDKAKEYLLSFRGLGLKSVECVRLLTLHHLAFPVDTNVGRIAVRLGWVPLQPLPESLQLHLLEMYPVLESIQKYLWPRLCKLDQKTLYELHYHMITFGKVFCTKRQPNCNACPLRGECRHFASAFASARLALPAPEERSIMASSAGSATHLEPRATINPLPLPPSYWGNHHRESNSKCNIDASIVEVPYFPFPLPFPQTIHHLERKSVNSSCDPIVEVPASPEPEPEPEQEQTLCDIEDTYYEDPNEIPTIKLNMKEFTQTLQNFMQANRELQEGGMSRALVALTPEAASIPTPKLKNINRLRTEHHVYELPDTHPLLKGLDKREPDDPCSYLLAIWTPGETANSIQPPERKCSTEDPSILCNEETCSYCNSQREANSQIVRGTLLIPCRTAMRGSFPLNGTYFQVNEVFADHDSSLNPIAVPRSWLWNLPRRTVYFGTSVPTIFRGLTTEDIQYCFWRGYVCVRGFDQKTRAPRPLMARLHFPASKMPRGTKGKPNDE